MKSAALVALLATVLISSPKISNADAEKEPHVRGVKIHVLSPRTGAELAPGADKVTIVVEVEDSTEEGVKLKKGIPVFDTPIRKDGKTNQSVQDNLDAFVKNLVGVTTYALPNRPGRPRTTVYQLTSVVPTVLLSGGCQLPVYPPNLELPKSGRTTVYPSTYVEGAALEFKLAGYSGSNSDEDSASPSRVCLVLPKRP